MAFASGSSRHAEQHARNLGPAPRGTRGARVRDVGGVRSSAFAARRDDTGTEGRSRARRVPDHDLRVPGVPHAASAGRQASRSAQRLFAGGIPFAGPWGLVHSANVSVPAASFPDRVLEDAIRGRLAYKFQMPTDLYRGMAADDMRDVVAFVKTLRPVSQPLPENHFDPAYAPPAPLADVAVPERAPAPGTPERGRYLARVAICQDCHSPRATGGDGDGTGLGRRLRRAAPLRRRRVRASATRTAAGSSRRTSRPILRAASAAGRKPTSSRRSARAITPDGRRLNPMMPYAVAFHVMTDRGRRRHRALPSLAAARPQRPAAQPALRRVGTAARLLLRAAARSGLARRRERRRKVARR